MLLVGSIFWGGIGILRSIFIFVPNSRRKKRVFAWFTLLTCIMLSLVSVIYF